MKSRCTNQVTLRGLRALKNEKKWRKPTNVQLPRKLFKSKIKTKALSNFIDELSRLLYLHAGVQNNVAYS